MVYIKIWVKKNKQKKNKKDDHIINNLSHFFPSFKHHRIISNLQCVQITGENKSITEKRDKALCGFLV